jgi:hypothetical protein
MHLLGLTGEQLGMVAAMWQMQPGDGKWLHASGIIGGGKTTSYEAFMAMAHTRPGWSVVATAQTNAGTLAVNGDKCLEALLEISYIRDRLVYFLSDKKEEEWTEPITLSHVVMYLCSPEVRGKLEEKLAPLSHLIIGIWDIAGAVGNLVSCHHPCGTVNPRRGGLLLLTRFHR